MRKPSGLVRFENPNSFEAITHRVCFALSRSANTKLAYWNDAKKWIAFCRELGTDPKSPHEDTVMLWQEAMEREELAPKTIARRIAALCSVYRRLCTRRGGQVATWNPFAQEEGFVRGTAQAVAPTKLALPSVIQKLLATCDQTEMGKRDAAIVRVMWSTGARRASILAMTFERVRKEGGNYVAHLIGKGNKETRALITGKAAVAFREWLTVLAASKISTGPIWRSRTRPLYERELDRMLRRRAKQAGVDSPSPHMFRVSFLTYNQASLEAKQDAAGHASPETTRLYDRASWRGREAFEKMPELEDVDNE